MPPLPPDKSLPNIPYFHSADAKPIYFTKESFYEKFGCAYQEEVTSGFDEHVNLVDFGDEGLEQINQDTMEASLMQSLASLAILDMGVVGHGLITTTALSKGAIVGSYAGSLLKAKEASASAYAIHLNQEFFIDAEKSGNLMRFLQHLPSHPDDIYEFYSKNFPVPQEVGDEKIKSSLFGLRSVEEFNGLIFHDPSKKKLLATANLHPVKFLINGKPGWCFKAMHDIEAGSLLGYNYWPDFLATAPRYFQKTGELIPTDAYVRRRCAMEFPFFNFQSKEHSESEKACSQGKKLYHKGKQEFDNKNYRQAIVHLESAVDFFTKNNGSSFYMHLVKCYSLLGACYLEMKYVEIAIVAYTNALKLVKTMKPAKEELLKKLQDKISTLEQKQAAPDQNTLTPAP